MTNYNKLWPVCKDYCIMMVKLIRFIRTLFKKINSWMISVRRLKVFGADDDGGVFKRNKEKMNLFHRLLKKKNTKRRFTESLIIWLLITF